jgi:hypothetical protein
MISDEAKFYIKIVQIDETYNFIVHNFLFKVI